jgi:hypothetical protein
MSFSTDSGARVMSSPCLMNGVMLFPKARTRIVRPLPNTSRVSLMRAGMEMRRLSTRSTNPSPSFSGRSVAIGCQSMHPASLVKPRRLDIPSRES